MKRTLSILLAMMMIASCIALFAFTASAEDETIDLLNPETLKHSVGGGNYVFEDGVLKANNGDKGDTGMMSEIFIEPGKHFYLEVTVANNTAGSIGIILGETSFEDPFKTGWICMNAGAPWGETRLFSSGAKFVSWEPYDMKYINKSIINNESYTIGLEITEDNWVSVYAGGERYGYRQIPSWQGGYVGLMTWAGVAEFTSYTLSYTDFPTDYKILEKVDANGNVVNEAVESTRELTFSKTINMLEEETLLAHPANALGVFEMRDGKLVADNGIIANDCMTTSEIFVEPGKHVYIEMTAVVTEGHAFGIAFGENDYEDPLNTGWITLMCGAISHDARLQAIGTAFNPYDPITMNTIMEDVLVHNKDITLGIEITEDNHFYLTINGKQFADRVINTWQGGYLGVMTWSGTAEISEFTLNYVGEPAAEEPVVEEPVVEEPVVEEPVVEEPAVTEEPKVEAPVVEAPKTADAVVVLLACASAASAAVVSFKKRH